MGLEALSLISKKESLHRSAVHMYILAALVSPVVVLTGLQDAEHIHLNHPILTTHRNFALLTMGGSLISLPVLWFVKEKNFKTFRILFLIFTIIIVTFVTIAAYNGGRMVYEYGVGMEE